MIDAKNTEECAMKAIMQYLEDCKCKGSLDAEEGLLQLLKITMISLIGVAGADHAEKIFKVSHEYVFDRGEHIEQIGKEVDMGLN